MHCRCFVTGYGNWRAREKLNELHEKRTRLIVAMLSVCTRLFAHSLSLALSLSLSLWVCVCMLTKHRVAAIAAGSLKHA